MKYLSFMLNNVNYAVDLDYVDSVDAYKGLPLRPFLLPLVIGTIEIKGQIVPVIDISKRIGLSGTDISKAKRIILFLVDDGTGKMISWGALVDWVCGVETIESYRFLETDECAQRKLDSRKIIGIADNHGSPVILLDVESFFTLPEIESLLIAS